MLARGNARRVIALGPLVVASRNGEGSGLTMELRGRLLEVAVELRELGCSVELATALNAMTFVGRYAVRDVEERGFGTRYLVHDGGLGDLGSCGVSAWGASAALVGVLPVMLAGRSWVVCDGSLGRDGLGIVEGLASEGDIQVVGMGAGRDGAALLETPAVWRGVCLDGPAWRSVGEAGCRGRDDSYRRLSRDMGSVALRVEVGNGVALTLRDGKVLGYSVWKGLAAETARLVRWLIDGGYSVLTS